MRYKRLHANYGNEKAPQAKKKYTGNEKFGCYNCARSAGHGAAKLMNATGAVKKLNECNGISDQPHYVSKY